MLGITQLKSTGNNTFSIAPYSFAPRSTFVYLNGLYLQWGIDYTEDTTNQGITITSVVPVGYNVEIRYQII